MLIERYLTNTGARFGARLAIYLDHLRSRDATLDGELVLHNLLRASADDPVMRETQDAFFDRENWQPAQLAATKIGLATLTLGGVPPGCWEGPEPGSRDLTLVTPVAWMCGYYSSVCRTAASMCVPTACLARARAIVCASSRSRAASPRPARWTQCRWQPWRPRVIEA
jgi:hypothetical protein